MVTLKSRAEIEEMRKAGRIVAAFHQAVSDLIVPGVTTLDIEAFALRFLKEKGAKAAIVGNRIGDVMHAVQSHAEQHGFSVVRHLLGHGVGREMHEEPNYPHVGKPGRGFPLKEGMVMTIEPMINAGTAVMTVDADGWTARTADGSLSAQYEHTIAITADGPIILTTM
ncbi:M24 family metallopeptidase [Paenibacillus sp. F411]|uniref:M24 family metallopeptidase n=1 Tax=Paenibacillus sp. F411 TaxID=2820239 RepID=UPI001AAF56DD|nr:M24 family metallopeptidase [Paenibacillus sp. F411]MBO2945779.1 M24 family metallopeptidase [Paenibacillus sp. F411]